MMETDWQALNCVVVVEAGNRRTGSRGNIIRFADLRYPYAQMDGIEMLEGTTFLTVNTVIFLMHRVPEVWCDYSLNPSGTESWSRQRIMH